MTELLTRLLRRIDLTGPIPFHEFWTISQYDPAFGYYTTTVPIGASGDFTTAPEISQMFGELLAAWWLTAVRENQLEDIHLVEIGPGRGTLMSDFLRTLNRLDPSLKSKLSVHLVDVSPRLKSIQQEKLKSSGFSITWHETIATLPHAPLGIIANELFDAIPVRPFVKKASTWAELGVSRSPNNSLTYASLPIALDKSVLPAGHQTQPDGTVFEYAPAREAFMANLAAHLGTYGGFGLFIDYGHAQSSFGDTVQAMRRHAFCSPLEDPGLVDITSHVDFAALAAAATAQNTRAFTLVHQGDFLQALGIKNRMERLCLARPGQQDALVRAYERLTNINQMGHLFKVLAIANVSINLPIFNLSG